MGGIHGLFEQLALGFPGSTFSLLRFDFGRKQQHLGMFAQKILRVIAQPLKVRPRQAFS